ncbi:MAG: polysaccharide pyruvyl transferase family protein, partial [Ignavibacteria bacterium]|nr:polysaccharide pyruvyl transferase family protein [Ignavibacteria bacterium]
PKVILALYKTDIFIFEGGPFYEQMQQVLVCWGLLSISKLFNKPVIAYAATVFYFRTWWGRAIYRNIFNRMDAVTVRESIGKEILNDLNIKNEVELFADPRFILFPLNQDYINEILKKENVDISKPYVCITTRFMHDKIPKWVKKSHHYNEKIVQDSNRCISKIIAYLSELKQVVLIPMHPKYEEDQQMANILRKNMQDPSKLILLSKRYRALEILGIINYAEMILASRVGSAVFSAVTKTPIIAVSYEPRMIDHMKRCGLGNYVFDWRKLNYEELKNSIDEILQKKENIKGILEANAETFKEQAKLNSEVIAKFI